MCHFNMQLIKGGVQAGHAENPRILPLYILRQSLQRPCSVITTSQQIKSCAVKLLSLSCKLGVKIIFSER